MRRLKRHRLADERSTVCGIRLKVAWYQPKYVNGTATYCSGCYDVGRRPKYVPGRR